MPISGVFTKRCKGDKSRQMKLDIEILHSLKSVEKIKLSRNI